MKTQQILLIIGGLLIVGFFTGYLKMPASVSGGAQTNVLCDPANGQKLSVAYLNSINPATDYAAASYIVTKADGQTVVATGTSTGGTSLSYSAATIYDCSVPNGMVKILGSTAVNAYSASFDFSNPYVVIRGSNTSRPIFKVTFNNESSATENDSKDAEACAQTNNAGGQSCVTLYGWKINSTQQVIAQGGAINDYIRGQVNTSATQFGSDQFGANAVVFAVDTVNASAFSAQTDITMSTIIGQPVVAGPCTNDLIQRASADVCFYTSPIKPGAESKWSFNAVANQGNPGISDSIKIIIADKCIFLDPGTNTYVEAYYDSAGTDKCQSNSWVKIVTG